MSQRYFRYRPETKEETEVEFSSLLTAQVLGLYFGAHGTSLKFTRETLVPYFFEANASRRQVELLYVNSDGSYREFLEHMQEQRHWATLPFQCSAIAQLKRYLNVTELPQLVFVEVKGMTVLAVDGKELVLKHGREAVDVAYARRQVKLAKPLKEEEKVLPVASRQVSNTTAVMGKSSGFGKPP